GPAPEDKRPVKKPAAAPGMEEADVEIEGAAEEGDEDVIEDTNDLEDDADAIGPDIEVEPDRDETER
ncbi:MAG: TIGR02300 family protein, partial [Rhodospirillales bacterium]|nr:TIGR02300 family protein [Rhodospirillales bacterium]